MFWLVFFWVLFSAVVTTCEAIKQDRLTDNVDILDAIKSTLSIQSKILKTIFHYLKGLKTMRHQPEFMTLAECIDAIGDYGYWPDVMGIQKNQYSMDDQFKVVWPDHVAIPRFNSDARYLYWGPSNV